MRFTTLMVRGPHFSYISCYKSYCNSPSTCTHAERSRLLHPFGFRGACPTVMARE